ncbi:uncharacterized protein LOC102681681 isoform X1 [Apis dorsata]|uniref:uncharacterized protein LOC102681681 isoform X1 n=2 Tax=Apis dorsata TaxID=7462 RepID=UPI001293723D|nr:uncharacterized protein LOC102681681 isoform X1 [Apis dorsata]
MEAFEVKNALSGWNEEIASFTQDLDVLPDSRYWRNILGECRPWWKGGEGWPGGDGFNRSILGSTSVTPGRGAGGAWHSPDPVGRTSTFASRTCNRGRKLRRMPSMKIFGLLCEEYISKWNYI